MGQIKHKVLEAINRLREENSVISFVWDVVQVFLDRRVTRSAAELSYYLMLTLFPVLIVVLNIIGMVNITPQQVTDTLSMVIPRQTLALLEEYLAYVQGNQSMGMLMAGVITTVTASSAALRGLLSISGEIYGRRAYRGVWSVLFSLVCSVLLVVMIYTSVVAVFTGRWFIRAIRRLFPLLHFPVAWQWLRIVVLFAVTLLFLMLLYRVTAPRGRNRPPVFTGALLSTCLLTAFCGLFSIFISLSSKYSMVYGSLASVIILMLWLFLCGNMIIIGNVFNYVWWRRKRGLPVTFLLEKLI